MKHRIFSLFTLIALLLSVSTLQAKESEGIYYYKTGFPRQAKKLLLQDLATGQGNAAETCYYLGNISYDAGLNDSAAYYYNKGLSVDPNSENNQVGLAKLQIKSDPLKASTTFENLLKGKNKKNVDLMIEIGQAYLSASKYDEALSYEAKAEAIKDKYAPVYVFKGDCYLAQRDPGKACENYEQAIYFDKNSKDAYIKYARAYKDVNTELAIQKLNELKALDPSFSLANEELAKLYYDKNRFGDAVKAFADYVASGNDTDQDLIEYCMALLMNGQYQDCLDIAKKGLARNPNNFVFNRMAMYSTIELDSAAKLKDPNFSDFTNADQFASAFLSEVPKGMTSYFDYLYLGRLYQTEKKYSDAAQSFENAIKKDSTKYTFYRQISDLYQQAGDYKSSIDAFEKLLKAEDPTKVSEDDYVGFGKKLYSAGTSNNVSKADQVEYLKRANEIFDKSIQMDPNDYRGYLYKGYAGVASDPNYTNVDNLNNFLKTIEVAKSKNDSRYNPVIAAAGSQAAIYYYEQFVKTKSEVDKVKCKNMCSQVLAVDASNSTCSKLSAVVK